MVAISWLSDPLSFFCLHAAHISRYRLAQHLHLELRSFSRLPLPQPATTVAAKGIFFAGTLQSGLTPSLYKPPSPPDWTRSLAVASVTPSTTGKFSPLLIYPPPPPTLLPVSKTASGKRCEEVFGPGESRDETMGKKTRKMKGQ